MLTTRVNTIFKEKGRICLQFTFRRKLNAVMFSEIFSCVSFLALLAPSDPSNKFLPKDNDKSDNDDNNNDNNDNGHDNDVQ